MVCKGLLGSRGQAQSGKPTQICDSRAHQSSNAWQDTASFGRVSGGSAVLSILQRVAWERSPKDPINQIKGTWVLTRHIATIWASLVAQMVKNLPAKWKTRV